MAERYYYLAQWDEPPETADNPDPADYAPPQGTVGLFDMTPLAGVKFGFFAADRQLTDDDWTGISAPDWHEFGDGSDLRDYHTSQSERDEWRSLLNLTTDDLSDTDVDTLYDALWLTFRDCGDPDHQNRFKPPTATSDGNVELYLGGHSLLERQAFTDLPQTSQDNIFARVQHDMARIVEQCRRGGPGPPTRDDPTPASDHYRKVATMWARKYSLDTSQRGGQRGWGRLFPRSRRGEVGPPMEPETTVSDDFTRADESLDAGNWTEVAGDWEVYNNQARVSYAWASARYERDLSSDDHYSQADTTFDDTSEDRVSGPTCRFDSASETYYQAGYHLGADETRLFKNENGSTTQLDRNPDTGPRTGTYTQRVKVDGSTIELIFEGSSDISVTDSSISGFLRCGLQANPDDTVGEYIEHDNFEAADLGAGVVGAPSDLAHGHTLASPGISQVHIISPNPLTHGHAASSPPISQVHVNSPAILSHVNTVSSPTAMLVYVGTPVDPAHGHMLSVPAITQMHVGSPAGLGHGHTLGSPGILQVHIVSPAGLSHGHGIAAPGISQVHGGTPVSSLHGHTVDAPGIGQVHVGGPTDLPHGHRLTVPRIGQVHIVEPGSLSLGHMLSVPLVEVVYLGDPADLRHRHAVERLIIEALGTLRADIAVYPALDADGRTWAALQADMEVR